MKVVAIKDMPEFSIKAGQSVDVTPGQFTKFQEKYHCFEEPDQNVLVRVKTNMHKLYIGFDGWIPYSLQSGPFKKLEEFIRRGDCVIEDPYFKPPSGIIDVDKLMTGGDPVYSWTFREDYNGHKKGETVKATTLEMQKDNMILRATLGVV